MITILGLVHSFSTLNYQMALDIEIKITVVQIKITPTFLHMLYIISKFFGFAKKAGVSTVM